MGYYGSLGEESSSLPVGVREGLDAIAGEDPHPRLGWYGELDAPRLCRSTYFGGRVRFPS